MSQKLECVFFESLINDSNIQFEVYLKEMYGSTVTVDNAFMFRHILGFLKALKINSFDNAYINDFEDRWTNALVNLLNQNQEQKSIESIIQVIQKANAENGAVKSEKMHRLLMNYRKYYAAQPPLATTSKVVGPTLASIASNSQSIHLDPIEHSCHEIAEYLKRKYSNQPSNINKFSEYINRKTQERHLSQLYSSAAVKDDPNLQKLSPEAFKKIAQIVMPEKLLIQSMFLSKYANLVQSFPLAINNPYYTALRWMSLVTLNPAYKNFSVPFFDNLTAIQALQLICAAIHDPDCNETDAQIESLYEIVISRMNDSIREYDHGNKLSADAPRCSKGLIQEILGSLSGATNDEQLNLKMITLDTLVGEIKEFYKNKLNQLDKNE
ncbi:TPA: hypothetical protein ACP9DH_002899 [Legionella anisa]